MKINHNMSAVIANNQLLRNETGLSESIERLSSGLKINHASDDPAGMAIATKMKAQIRGLDQASRNASDGISVLDAADGALEEVTNMLQRMRELSVQAANTGVYSQEDLEAIQAEITSLTDEIGRISTDTEFNTKKLLDGSLDQRVFVNSRSIDRIEISDFVATGKYEITIEQDARQAVLLGKTITDTAVPAGVISINGVNVKIEEGQDLSSVYESLRDAAEIGEVNLFAVDNVADNTSGLPENAGYTPSGIGTGKTLVFVSDRYGSSTEMKITCDNEELANYFGVPTTTKAVASVSGTGTVKDTTDPIPEGTITINGTEVTVEATDTLDDVYQKLKVAAAGQNINVFHADTRDHTQGREEDAGYTPSADPDPAGKYLVFVSDGSDASKEIQITCDSQELASYLGLSTSMEGKSITESSVTVKGTDAAVGLGRGAVGDLVTNFSNQASCSSDGNFVTITDRNGFKITFEVAPNTAGTTFQDVVGMDASTENVNAAEVTAASVSDTITMDVTDIGTMTLHIGANENQTMDVRIPAVSPRSLYIDDVDVCTVTGADRAITAYDRAIAKVSESRSRLGAYTNRLEHAVASLDATEENMTSALSRIEDVDMAEEMSTYTQYTVLSQAATAVLAQANDIPQQALQLLQ